MRLRMQIFGSPLQNCHHERSEGSVLASNRKEVPSGAKARVSIVSLMARLKPCPFRATVETGGAPLQRCTTQVASLALRTAREMRAAPSYARLKAVLQLGHHGHLYSAARLLRPRPIHHRHRHQRHHRQACGGRRCHAARALAGHAGDRLDQERCAGQVFVSRSAGSRAAHGSGDAWRRELLPARRTADAGRDHRRGHGLRHSKES